MKQAPSSILMVRPEHFAYNPETADSNTFQSDRLLCDKHKITQNALKEFDAFVSKLKDQQIDVHVFDSPRDVKASDAVFPNNWISFHEDGKVILYPMLTANRRIERRTEIIESLSDKFYINEIIDISANELQGKILEGTGSIVFDHINKVAYANESPRTNKNLFYDVCEKLGYEGIFFKAVDERGIDIYHTNVMMTVCDGFAIICKETIDRVDVATVINSLQSGGLQVIEISYKQMKRFAGNVIQVRNSSNDKFLVMSDTAFNILSEYQKKMLTRYAKFIHPRIDTIETVGGGSARCMIAGIHLQKKRKDINKSKIV